MARDDPELDINLPRTVASSIQLFCSHLTAHSCINLVASGGVGYHFNSLVRQHLGLYSHYEGALHRKSAMQFNAAMCMCNIKLKTSADGTVWNQSLRQHQSPVYNFKYKRNR
jgi:hypothetical protein